MNRTEAEKEYINYGLKDFKLTKAQDLLYVHGIKCQLIKGYSDLSDANKDLYKRFIVNFFNAQGLDSRLSLIPKGIYFVQEDSYYFEENANGQILKQYSGAVIYKFKANGKKVIHKKYDFYQEPEYKDLPRHISGSETYLRIEYKHKKRNEWLHIKNEHEWY